MRPVVMPVRPLDNDCFATVAMTINMAIVMVVVMMPAIDMNASATDVNVDSLRERGCIQDRTGHNQSK